MEKIIRPQVGGNIKFSPCPGFDLSAGAPDLSKLSPSLVIVIGLSVIALGLYLLSKEKQKN
jgi:hypothetical protein